VLGLATLASIRERLGDDPLLAFTSPPFGAPMLAMATWMAWQWRRVAPDRHLTLAQLNATTRTLLLAWATYFIVIVAGDLQGLLAELAKVPIDLAMAHSSMWGLLLVATGVFLPTSREAGTRRIALLAACAFAPDLIVFGSAPSWPTNGLVYVATKTVMVGFYAAFAAYGGHRIEQLRRDAQAARQLGQYVLGAPLGSGGMGEVHLAEHRLLRRPCAVKLIKAEQAGDESTLRRFEREAQATAALTHPSTVQVFDYGITDDGTFYYVMEYLDGETLDALLTRTGAQPPARVAHIVTQLCGALQEAHDRGLVHRDIKPANVMLCNRGGVRDVAKLLDFGLVAPVRIAADLSADHGAAEVHPTVRNGSDGNLTEAGHILGTPAYMSPEQCAGEGAVAAASDIYSLGALTFALLTGRGPFAGRGPMQMVMAHLNEPPPRADAAGPAVPAGMADVVERAMAKAPAGRFVNVAAFGDALETAARSASLTR
jgi:serine/threonine-protein kinase